MYAAQYDHAQRLLVVPYDTFHRIAADINLLDPLVMIYSTGRAGSTLMSKAFTELGAVTSLSEPDVYTQAVLLRSGGVPDHDIRDVLGSATRILFNPVFTRRSTLNVVQFRSFGIELGDLLFDVFPRARRLFLYRDLAPFIRSWIRAFPFDELPPESRRASLTARAPITPLLAEELRHRSEMTGVEMRCLSWLSVVHAYIRLVRAGISMLPVRYEDLTADPAREFERIFRCLELPVDRVQSVLPAFDRDSQAGSVLSREEAGRRNVTIDDRQWELVRDLVRRYPVTADDISDKSIEVP
jgi:hypothetical protein